MIPLAKDTRAAIGEFADLVQNRALLFEKMVLAKSWGHAVRFNDANRFNVLRACSSGPQLLREDAKSAMEKAEKGGRNAKVEEYKADIATALAKVNVDDPELARRQVENSLQLLWLIEQSYPGKCATFAGALGGRLLINMAGGVQENAGLALDRCFGLPYIPGSAVKGITRHAALWDIRNTSERSEKKRKLRLALFAFGFIAADIRQAGNRQGDFAWAAGDAKLLEEVANSITPQDSFKGLLSFLQAHPTNEPTIVAEVLTPHPRAAAVARGKDDVRPIFFPAVKEGSSFGFALVACWSPPGAPVLEVTEQAANWLRTAITIQGVGAKTGAGYGWFILNPQADEQFRAGMTAMIEKSAKDHKLAADEMAASLALVTAQPDPAIAQSLKALPADKLRAIVNKFEFADHKFWPKTGEEASPVFQLTLLELILSDAALRADVTSKTKGAKALKQLAIKFNRALP